MSALRDEPLLDRGIVLHRAVAVEMVGRDVEQHADARVERGREIDLKGRAFDDMNARLAMAAPGRGSARRCCRRVATSRPASRRICAISAVVVDLPLVPVMATNGAVRRAARRARGEQLDVADDLDAGRLGARRRSSAARDGSAARRATAPGRRSAPVGAGEIDQRKARGARAFARAASLSSQAATSAPPATSARAVDEARAAEAEHGDACPAKRRDRGHRHLSFSVARPTSASTKAMIQKRMTICGSDQPSCSK